MSTKLLCFSCGKEWEYKGNSTRATCPKCQHKVNTVSNNKLRKHFIRLDLTSHGKTIVEFMNEGREWVILDCIGNNVLGVSTIDLT